jgi:signal transduction histidine kinase
MLIGFVPFIFLVYLSFRLHSENTKKVELLGSYIERIHESVDIAKLIDNLQIERRYSFQHALTKGMAGELQTQRPKTDSIIQKLSAYKSSLADFRSYTFLNNLSAMRTAIDSGHVTITMVMDYYTNVLYRFNTLDDLPTGSDIFLEPVYKDLVSQKILSDMVTHLSIMCANVYNALYTRQYMLEILMGTRGVYQFYNSYEKELLLKASPVTAGLYQTMKSTTTLQPVKTYLDRLFSTFSFDSTYDAAGWAKASFSAIDEIRNLQQNILRNAETQISEIYDQAQASNRNTLIFLVIVIAFVVLLSAYTIQLITKTLKELKFAARQIAKGKTDLPIRIDSRDAIGSLARSISEIDANNKRLAEAATAIGNGNFSTPVQPRSSDDLLGNAIVRMKNNLQQIVGDLKTAQRENLLLNKELENKVMERTAQLNEINKELESFSYSVSHDLRAPLRAISGYAHILREDLQDGLDKNEATETINKIIRNSTRMGRLIDDLIALSKLGAKDLSLHPVDMKSIAQECVQELLKPGQADKYDIQIHDLHKCKGDENLLRQVWSNLVGNAVKYSSKAQRPHIEISSKEDEKNYTYFVRDNGVGFDMKYAHKLFGVFQRLHSDEEFEGTGIGLVNVKRIITKHKGEIGAESFPGNGSTFWFSLPK